MSCIMHAADANVTSSKFEETTMLPTLPFYSRHCRQQLQDMEQVKSDAQGIL